MSWHFLPDLVGASWDHAFSVGGRSARSNSIHIAERCFSKGKKMVCWTCFRYGTMSEPSTDDRGMELWILSLLASRANHLALPEKEKEKTTSRISGLNPSASFAKYDPASACWRTSQVSLFTNTLDEYSETWPRAGIIADGIVYQRPPLAPLTRGTGSGLWLPTPCAQEGGFNKSLGINSKIRPSLAMMARKNLWPMPNALVGGRLNPRWVEWLMGWPIGWTSLEPLEMDKFQEWFKKHGENCPNELAPCYESCDLGH